MTKRVLSDKTARQTNNWPDRGHDVLYLRVYSKFTDDANADGGYVGWTTDAKKRDDSHRKDAEAAKKSVSTQAKHYRIVRNAENVSVYILADEELGSINAETPMYSRMAEQTLILLLNTYVKPDLVGGDLLHLRLILKTNLRFFSFLPLKS